MNDRPRYKPAPALIPQSGRRIDQVPKRLGGLSLTSDAARMRMVEQLQRAGIKHDQVLSAMRAVQRHLFVDQAFASRAYEDAALPIGHQQTISKPSTVARYLEYALEGRNRLETVLEVGAGCGYQAAVFAQVAKRVVSIERIGALYERARGNLEKASVSGVTCLHGDGLLGFEKSSPYDVIIVAAAGLDIPSALMKQLKVGGRLIVPVSEAGQQILVTVDRVGADKWHRENRDLVKFVPLLQGTRDV